MPDRLQHILRIAAVVTLVAFPAGAAAETFVAPPDVAPDTAPSDATSSTGDAGNGDTATAPDASDASAIDVGATDVGATDVGAMDGGAMDVADGAGGDDGGILDGGSADGGTGDVGDTRPTDAGAPDVSDTMGGDDATDAAAPDAVAMPDVGADADATRRARFFGEVSVQNRRDDSGVTVSLQRTDVSEGWVVTTGPEGKFSFDELPLGSYEVEVSREGFVTIMESFTLEGDREVRYRLFEDQDVDLRVRALFSHVDEPPEEVSFALEGERGSKSPDGPIAVEEGVAEWKIDELGVGVWTLEATAEKFEDLSYNFELRGQESKSLQLDVRLFLSRADTRPPPPDTSGCGCRNKQKSNSPRRNPTQPFGRIVLLFISLLFSKRLLSAYRHSDD